MNDPSQQATQIQRLAAHPGVSVSLRASAGSGKTKVLVDRFLRLCIDRRSFRADPRSILAVTFTRKAAVEIQERLLKRSRALALASEDELRTALAELLGRAEADVEPVEMQAASGLYEKVLEDLSGLNVGTIHAFCQSILNRLAAEEGLAPHAAVLESTDDLVEEALDRLEERIAREGDLQLAARLVGEDPGSVRSAVRKAFGQRLRLQRWARSLGERQRPAELARQMATVLGEDLLAELDIPSGDPRVTLPAAMRTALQVFVRESGPRIRAGIPADISKNHANNLEGKLQRIQGQAQERLAAWPEVFDTDFLQDLKGLFLTKSGTPRVHSKLKEVGSVFNDLVAREAVPLLALARAWSYLDLLDLNAGLLRLVLELLAITRAIKSRDQVIDFQDLEETACRLMGDQARALSLLYRLDDSISHILLDEFQDTNINQWEILAPFVEEFLSGGSDPDRLRTVFLVGDVKQSIYGFRGAEPELFLQVTDLLLRQGQKEYTLPTNFRSLPAVVESVGCVFTAPPLVDLLPAGEADKVAQAASRQEESGSVTVLAPMGPADDEDDDRTGDQRAAETAARQAARLVQEKKASWDDILVLCRTRTEIGVYEKAFRDLGIPIASAGRGMLAAGREVQDILALLRWLTYPEDDVALATVLRAPLLRVSEKDFQRLLAERGLDRKNGDGRPLPPHGLWQTLRRRKDDPLWSDTLTLLRGWRRHLGLEPCHDLLRRIYRDAHVLHRYQAAGGDQARHNLLRLFDLALAPEVAATPTVRQLIAVIDMAARLGGEEEAVTPPAEHLGRVRFMTIHGAKGLEAPVVFLVDADRSQGKESNDVRLRPEDPCTPLLQKVTREHRQGMAIDAMLPSLLERAADNARARDAAEDANLLYVAMTRARDHLYVMGGDKGSRNHASALRQLMAAAEAGRCEQIARTLPEGLEKITVKRGSGDGVASEKVVRWDPPVMKPTVRTVTPSAVEEQAALPAADPPSSGETDRRAAIRRGDGIHLLLQLAADRGAMPPGGGPDHAEAAAVFANPAFHWVFHPEKEGGLGLSEAPIIHRIPGGKTGAEERVTGIIDRLVFREGRVDIIDYKTNRMGTDGLRIPELVDHYRPQLEAYRAALAAMHPDAVIRTWLLFTDPEAGAGGRLEEVH